MSIVGEVIESELGLKKLNSGEMLRSDQVLIEHGPVGVVIPLNVAGTLLDAIGDDHGADSQFIQWESANRVPRETVMMEEGSGEDGWGKEKRAVRGKSPEWKKER